MDLATETLALVDEAWRRGLSTPPAMTVSEWADRSRMLPSENAEPGPWRTDRVPYLREIMDQLSISTATEQVVFMKGSQTGGTEAALNAIGYWIDHAPGSILAVWPSIDMVRRNSRIRIEPLIAGTPAIRAKIVQPKAKEPGNTISQKEFPGGSLMMTGANSATALRSTAARYLVLDEVDAFPMDVDEEGDPVSLAIQRTVTFRGRRKIVMISTPTIAGVSRIERAWFLRGPTVATGEPVAYVDEDTGEVSTERPKRWRSETSASFIAIGPDQSVSELLARCRGALTIIDLRSIILHVLREIEALAPHTVATPDETFKLVFSKLAEALRPKSEEGEA